MPPADLAKLSSLHCRAPGAALTPSQGPTAAELLLWFRSGIFWCRKPSRDQTRTPVTALRNTTARRSAWVSVVLTSRRARRLLRRAPAQAVPPYRLARLLQPGRVLACFRGQRRLYFVRRNPYRHELCSGIAAALVTSSRRAANSPQSRRSGLSYWVFGWVFELLFARRAASGASW
jgi:hypothetical protein